MPDQKPLDGRAAMITGCSRRIGIGFAIANRLAGLGADLFLHSYAPYDTKQPWGVDPNGMPTLLDELLSHGRHVEHLEANFLDPTAPFGLMDSAVKAFGHIDILIANHAYGTLGALEDLSAS